MVENMSSSTADALGLSRAILCNDSLIKKLEELERTEMMTKIWSITQDEFSEDTSICLWFAKVNSNVFF